MAGWKLHEQDKKLSSEKNIKLLWRKPKKKVEVEAPLKCICGCIWVKIIQNMPLNNDIKSVV